MNSNSVTPEQIERLMASLVVKTTVFPGTTTTVAAAFLPNGFSVGFGISACIDPANFDAEKGERIATTNALNEARQKLWAYEGYALRKAMDHAALMAAQPHP
jgi:hypothetical protein